MSTRSQTWQIDKRIPVSLIVTIIVVACGWVWSLSQLNSKVENAIKTFTDRMDVTEKTSNDRFSSLTEQRKEQTTQNEKKFDLIANQMLELQKTQTQLIVKGTEVSSDVKGLAQGVNDIKDALRKTAK